MIKAVVWDIGGVLSDNPKITKFWEQRPGSQELRDEFGSGNISKEEFVSRGAKILDLTQSEFLKEYNAAYLTVDLNNEVFKIYRAIKLKRYILSDTNRIHTDYIRPKMKKVFDLANGVFLSQEIGHRKSDTNTFRWLAKKIKLNPEEILFIDDHEGHIERAKSIGINTITYETPKQLVSELIKLNIPLPLE